MGNAPPPEDETPIQQPINLMRGWPNPSLLPADLIRKAANDALSKPAVAADGLLYGPDAGYEPCRSAIARWLTSFYQPATSVGSVGKERICITGGVSQNLGCMLSVYTDPNYTRNIWIVAPAYMLAFRVFEDAGFAGRMRAVPEDEEGVDLQYLREQLQKSEDQAQSPAMNRPKYKPARDRVKVFSNIIYCVPTFANPSSRTMSLQHRTELVRIARDFDALLVADDVDDFLQWPAKPAEPGSIDSHDLEIMKIAHLPRLVDVDRTLAGGAEREEADGFGNACSNGSFSKIVGPGVRVGWVEGTEKFAYGVSQCGTTASGGAPSQLTSTYITTLLTSGSLDSHIQKMLRPAYLRRYATLMKAIDSYLIPLGFILPQPKREVVGGYFTWLELPKGLSANALARRCKEHEVIVAPGTIFEVPGDKAEVNDFDGHLRLCFAWEEESLLADGVKRVGDVAKKMLREGASNGKGGVGGGGGEAFLDFK